MRRRDAIELRHAHDLVASIPQCSDNACEGCRAEAAMALDVIEHLLRRHSRPWRRAVLPHKYPADVVVTGRTAQDVTRLLREPTDEDVERVARELCQFRPACEVVCRECNGSARAAIAAYRSPEEADHA